MVNKFVLKSFHFFREDQENNENINLRWPSYISDTKEFSRFCDSNLTMKMKALQSSEVSGTHNQRGNTTSYRIYDFTV